MAVLEEYYDAVVIGAGHAGCEAALACARLDLKEAGVDAPVLWISAANEDGLDALEQTIRDMFEQGMIAGNDEVVITNARQKTCLLNACESLRLAEEGIENGMPEDMLTIDMMDAYTSLGEVIGEEIEEDLVNRIFAKFCMGK